MLAIAASRARVGLVHRDHASLLYGKRSRRCINSSLGLTPKLRPRVDQLLAHDYARSDVPDTYVAARYSSWHE